jgi:hypothetical protein
LADALSNDADGTVVGADEVPLSGK